MSSKRKQSAKGGNTKGIDINRLEQALMEIRDEEAGDKPEGFTAKEYAKEVGRVSSVVHGRLKKLTDAGILKRTLYNNKVYYYTYV